MDPSLFYVGFGTLEGLLNSHQKDRPIYLELVWMPPAHCGPIERRHHVIVVTDIQDGVCRYWRQTVAASDFIGGRPFEEAKVEKAMARAEQARLIVEKHIRTLHKFEVQGALVAMPRELRLLDGVTDCLRYDQATDSYTPA